MLQSVSFVFFFFCTIISDRCLQFALHTSNTAVFWHDVRWCRPLSEKKRKTVTVLSCVNAFRQHPPHADRKFVFFSFSVCTGCAWILERKNKGSSKRAASSLALGLDLVKRNLGSTFLSDDSFKQVLLKSGTVRCLFVGTVLFSAGICIPNRTVFNRHF